ncbi:hypothetical protein U1Q18_019587 [Sarracenia purpurea var. burkii]
MGGIVAVSICIFFSIQAHCCLRAGFSVTFLTWKTCSIVNFPFTSWYIKTAPASIQGRISDRNLHNHTHAFYMRFQRKEDLSKFYNNPFYLGVLKDYVMPYCHGLINVDFESDVEDDILPIFRKGEEFNNGVEFILLIEFLGSALGMPAEDALASLEELTKEFPSLIVQATQGVAKFEK